MWKKMWKKNLFLEKCKIVFPKELIKLKKHAVNFVVLQKK